MSRYSSKLPSQCFLRYSPRFSWERTEARIALPVDIIVTLQGAGAPRRHRLRSIAVQTGRACPTQPGEEVQTPESGGPLTPLGGVGSGSACEPRVCGAGAG